MLVVCGCGRYKSLLNLTFRLESAVDNSYFILKKKFPRNIQKLTRKGNVSQFPYSSNRMFRRINPAVLFHPEDDTFPFSSPA